MAVNNPYQTYQNNQVTTSTPAELTLMLYNGAIRFIKQTKLAIDEGKMDKANEYNIRAQDIITELMITLNMDYEISHQLLPLYDYMKNRLIEANLKKDKEILTEVEGFVVELRDTWSQAMKLAKQQG
ncbi:flagellar export chaperone FliS [Microaerobacter geothermalis]|uniref:flagellar export chaperone FliS n=1 Tax=Microaerobacter geothermalis TaxID=674972 RepID=UPI001F1A8032|nr:flagellar export chaperone FliS [Microaerobacter geothermalis]MCF6093425.1 flagellar export chaperone FliS [Microaerobacter geothermalis]